MNADPKLRWAYIVRWRVDIPQGQLSPYTSLRHFDVFIKQLSAVGFEAIETFGFSVNCWRCSRPPRSGARSTPLS